VSEQNVELHRQADEAFNRRDINAYLAYCDPQIEFHSVLGTAFGRPAYHGHEGVRAWHRDVEDVFGDELRIEPEAYFDLGENTISFHLVRGRGRQSGAEVAEPYAHVCRWREGLIVYFRGYAHREDALRDLGVSEGELEPIAP
jgi:ketosteroid isomerase-like protein